MKRGLWIIIGFVIVVAIVVGVVLTQRPARKEPEVYKIGAILPLTGDAAQYGKWAKNGIELAVKEINSRGGIKGKKLKVIYEDSQAQPQKGVAAARKLITVDKVPVIIGAMASGVTLAIAPIAQANKVVLFSPASSNPKIPKMGDFIFRNWPSDLFEGRTMAEFAYDRLGVRKVGVIYVNTDYGIGIKDVFKRYFTSLGGKILFEEGYPQGETNFRSILTKIKIADIDALYIPAQYSREIARLLKQMKELKIKKQVLSTVTFESSDVLNIAGVAAEGVIYTAPAFDLDSPEDIIKNFRRKYESDYKEKPEIFAAHAYDATKIIALAIERGGHNSTSIRDALFQVKSYPGVTGETSFDKDGDVIKPAMIKTVKNGEFTILIRRWSLR